MSDYFNALGTMAHALWVAMPYLTLAASFIATWIWLLIITFPGGEARPTLIALTLAGPVLLIFGAIPWVIITEGGAR